MKSDKMSVFAQPVYRCPEHFFRIYGEPNRIHFIFGGMKLQGRLFLPLLSNPRRVISEAQGKVFSVDIGSIRVGIPWGIDPYLVFISFTLCSYLIRTSF